MEFVKTNLQYNYNHNQKDYLLFLRIPKNASSSIMEHLLDRDWETKDSLFDYDCN